MRPGSCSRAQSGFTLLAILCAMLLLALASNGVMTYVSQEAQRQRENELLRIGNLYIQAIRTYYENSPGTVKQWPPSLEALTLDPRFLTIKRHMRQVYADPVTHSADWGIVKAPDGGIAGVYSTSKERPLQTGAVSIGQQWVSADQYADWRFVYEPPVPTMEKSR